LPTPQQDGKAVIDIMNILLVFLYNNGDCKDDDKMEIRMFLSESPRRAGTGTKPYGAASTRFSRRHRFTIINVRFSWYTPIQQ